MRKLLPPKNYRSTKGHTCFRCKYTKFRGIGEEYDCERDETITFDHDDNDIHYSTCDRFSNDNC